MVVQPTFGTDPNFRVDNKPEKTKKTPKQICEEGGGFWDETTQTCVRVQEEKTNEQRINQAGGGKGSVTLGSAEEQRIRQEEIVRDQQREQQILESGKSFIRDAEGNIRLTSEQNINQERADILRTQEGRLTDAQLLQQQQIQAQNQQLAGQVGQFTPLGVEPTDISQTELIKQGFASAIPRALSLAATGAALGAFGGGAAGGIAAPVTAPAGAIIGGIGGFISGITGALISNYRSQRTDTVNAQKRVLDEGKQTLQDWVTLAKTDPTNRREYLANFNRQLALIDQAYRQMKLDTQRDVLKFETAIPDLAEFEAFYNSQGERDFLVQEMRFALATPTSPEYDMLELSNRRLNK